MAKAHIVFDGSANPIVATKIESFTVVQNNRKQVIHIVDYVSRGANRQMTFLNLVEATLLGSRYIRAQSKLDMCAKLQFVEGE